MTARKWNYLMRTMVVVLLVAVIGFTFVACGQNNSTPISGVYYYEAEGEAYQITLSEDYGFVLDANGEIRSGEYFGDGKDLRLVFGKDDETTAKLENGVFKLTYGGATFNMLQRVNYTVTFNTNGGNAVAAQTVLNGKTATQPADPTRANDRFLGWYVDSSFSAPFNFATTIITQDTTVYANWEAKNPNQPEYVVNFDANYQGAAAVEAQNTYNGKLTSLPTVSREGYTFAGWWVSSLNDGSKLSYQCGTDYVFSGNTTLYAMWLQDGAVAQPVVTVTGTSISWTTVANAEYVLSVTGPEGFTAINKTTQASSEAFNFANAPAGVYEISVVAKVGQNQSAESVVYYVNNGLATPEVWVAEPATLVYSQVPNAEKYIVTIECGSQGHQHYVDNGKNTTLPFANCEMKEGGIVFTVTAVANGYAPATATYVYNKVLAQVTGVSFDSATETLTWAQVVGATNYAVAVTVGGQTYNYNNGTSNSFSLKTFAQGEISVAIVAQSKGYNSPEATVYNYTKTTLPAPANVAVNGNNVTWDAVEGATKYLVSLNGTAYEATTASFDLTTAAGLQAGSKYQLSVTAVKDGVQSLASTVTVAYQILSNVSYYANVATWDAVAGATKYKVKVTGASEFEVVGANFANVTFTQAGANTIAVSFYNGSAWSNWVETTVQVYAIEFDARLGEAVDAVYVATGDSVALGTTTRPGYDFAGWFNAPGGAAAGAYQYVNGFVYDKTTGTVLFAAWTPMKATVSYNFLGFGENADFGTTTVTFGKDFALKVPTAPSTAYTFAGWFADIACKEALTDANGNSLEAWNHYLAERTVYAKWYQLLSYTMLSDGTYRIKKGPDIGKVAEVTIPAEIDGIKVTQVAGFAFDKCYDLKVINIPDTVQYIDILGKAFNQCTRLQAINVYHVEGNNEIVYKSENGILLAYDKNGTQKLELGFVPVTMQGKFEIPAGVEVIPEKIFAKSAITEIVIPASVSIIEANAFLNCAQLQKVTFLPAEAGQTAVELTIGQNAFKGCKILEEITLPARCVSLTTTETGEINAFSGCTSLENVFVEAGNAVYKNPIDKTGVLLDKDGTLVYAPNATEGAYTIPSGVTAIGAYAFAQASGVTEVTIPAWVTRVEAYAFYGIANLQKVTFAASTTDFGSVTIGAHAFDGCTALATVDYQGGAKIVEIGAYAFANIKALQTLEIPATVTKVGDYAFTGCSARYATIADGENAITFGTGVYANCTNLYSITLPARVTALPEGAFGGCSSLRDVKVDENNQILKDIDGVLFTKDGKELLFFSAVRGGTYEIPAGVEVIGSKVFADNSSLTGITLGPDVTTISNRAFYNCTGLAGATLTIGPKVTYIGEYAFYNTGISKLIFDQTGTEELAFAKGAFRKAINNTSTSTTSSSYFELELPARLKAISEEAFYESKFVAVKFNEGTQTIGNYAFANNSYLYGNSYNSSTRGGTLAFPQSVTTVGDYAFYKCTKLTVLDLDEVENWGKYAFADCSGITGITFPTAWEVIPEGFMSVSSGMKNFKSTVTIAKTVKQIEYRAFYGAFTYATGLVFEDGGTEDLIIGTKGKQDVRTGEWVDNGTYTSEVFYKLGASNSSFKVVNLPDRLTIIGISTFESATKITNFNVSENSRLANIGEEAFYGCSALTSFFIPSTVKNMPQTPGYEQACAIGYRAFYNCSKLATITFEKDETATAATAPLTLDSQAFYGCKASGFTTLNLPGRMAGNLAANGVDIVLPGFDLNTFNATYLKTITIDEGEGCVLKAVNNIIYSADLTQLYYAAAKLAGEITIPKQTINISASAFKSNTNITKVIFEDGGTSNLIIGKDAFSGCTKITEATLPERVTEIGASAFYNCKALPSIYIPASVTSIGASAFGGSGMTYTSIEYGRNADGTVNFTQLNSSTFNAWEGLTTWEVPEGVQGVADGFITSNSYRDAITKFVFPSTLTSISTNDRGLGTYKGLTEVVFNNNPNFKTVDGAVYTADGATLLAVLVGIDRDVFEVARGTEVIAGYSFWYADIATVVVPNTVQEMKPSVFPGSYVENVTLEDGDIPLTISNSFSSMQYLEEILIPARAIEMKNAFSDSRIKKIDFAPNSRMERIEGLFLFTPQLEEVTIPKSVRVITQAEEFSAMDKLRKVTFEEGSQLVEWGVPCGFVEAKLLPDKVWELTEDINGDGVIDLDDLVLTPVELVNFPFETVMVYANGSLANTNITEATFAEGITTIPTGLFSVYVDERTYYKKNLIEKVTIPSTVTTIGASAFAGTHITEIVLPDGLVTIGDMAFESCTELTTVKTATSDKWPAGLQRIGKKAFAGTAISYVYLPNTITNGAIPNGAARDQELGIDDSAFENCVNLTNVEIQEGGTAEFTIGKNAFKNTAITSFNFEALAGRLVDGFTTETANNLNDRGAIREGAFEGTKLTEVVLPYSMKVTYIGTRAFANCQNLVNVTLGFGLEIVEERAFENCANLEYVFIPASVRTFDNAFFGCDKVALDLDPDNLDFTMINGVMYNAAETAIIYVAKDASGEVNMPNTVKTVAQGAFKGVAGITAVKLSSALTTVEESMFEGSGVTSVVIPKGVTTIGKNAFKNCVNLQTVTFEKGGTKILTIGQSAFQGCTSLLAVEIPDRCRTNSGVSNPVYPIGDYAFQGCTSLASVTFEEHTDTSAFEEVMVSGIPRDVLAIGNYAFQGCTALTQISFPYRLLDVSTSKAAIGNFAFDGCTQLATVNFWTNPETGNVGTWHSSYISMGGNVFTNTALTTILIPYYIQFARATSEGGGFYGIKYFNGEFASYTMEGPFVNEGVTITYGPAN